MPKIMLGGIEVASVIPVGSARDFYGTVVPDGFLSCDGQAVLQADYPALFAVIGTLYNTTGGVVAPLPEEFRIPPQQVGGLGLYHRGVGATAVGAYVADVMFAHQHYLTAQGCDDGSNNRGNLSYSSNHWTSQTVGDPTETRPRSATVLKCIKV